jgi:hypothetical protein
MVNPAAAINANQGIEPAGDTSITLGFTPTSGNVLVLITAAGAVQTISGWTKHRVALSDAELAFWTRTSIGNESTVTYSQNGPRALAWGALELPAGTTFTIGSASSANDDTFSSADSAGLTADNKLVFWGIARVFSSAGSWSGTWGDDAVEWVEQHAPHDGNEGVGLAVGFYEGTDTAVTATATTTGGQPARHKIVVAAYIGSGGGGGNVSPTANAGADQSVVPSTQVTLNGSGSTDPDGTITLYDWVQVSGPASVTLSGTGASRTFTPSVEGTYVFGLTVTDNDGATSSQDNVSVTVSALSSYDSLFGASTPPGTWTAGADGTPSIITGTCYYFTAGSAARGSNIMGGRWWCPAGLAGETVRFDLLEGTVDLPNSGSDITIGTTPVIRTKTVTITNNAAHWLEALFDTPYEIPENQYRMYGITTEVTSDPVNYNLGTNFRASSDPIQHPSVSGWYLSEASVNYEHAIFRIGTNTPGTAATTSWYGQDLLIDIAAPVSDEVDPPSALNVSRGILPSGATSIPIDFTPTANSVLMLFAGAAATQTVPGWTRQVGAIQVADVAVFWKTATGSETSIPFTQNAARSLAYTLVELPAGTTLSEGVASTGTSDAFNTGSTQGFPAGVNKIVFWITGRVTSSGSATQVGTWGSDATEMTERMSAHEGCALWIGFYEGTAVNVAASLDTAASAAMTSSRHQVIVAATLGSGGGNTAPTANAGSDQTVAPNTLVTLNASASTDSDGTIASYGWTQTSGTGVTLSGSGATRTFTPTATGTYVFQVTVTDDDGATASDSVQINVQTGNLNPTANAGADQSVTVNTLVTLSGSASSDPDGNIVSYAWGQISGTTVSLAGSGATRTFTPTTAGSRTFQLTVTDNNGAVGTDTVVVTVSNPASNYGASVAADNALAGDPENQWWQGLSPLGLPSFPRRTYYAPGETARFSVDCDEAFNITIRRLGHYGGNGARIVQAAYAGTPAIQPAPVVIAGGNGAVTCAAWEQNAEWQVPVDALPGWYMAFFRRTSDNEHGYALFCVSDAAAKRPILIVTGDATWHAAYNGFGGNNVYGAALGIGSIGARAFCSTYDKPVLTHAYVPQTHFFNNTYPYVAWSERMGYEAGAATIEQINADPTILDGRALIVFVGHNEYIPQNVMNKTKSLLTAGQKFLNVAGNDFFWRVKFTNGAFSSSNHGRNMWCKKDTMSGPSTGPDAVPSHAAGTPFTTAADWTGTWQDTRWVSREPSEDFFGDQFIANGIRADSVSIPNAMKSLPPWRNCPGIIALGAGQSYNFAPGTLGMEWDRPMLANPNVEQILFSSTEIDLTGAADVNGETYSNTSNDTIHGFAVVRSGNGYVANFNSDQWAWALSQRHLRGNTAPDVNAMQMMLNVISDFGVQPDTSSVTTVGLTMPTPVPMSAYGFDDGTTPPPTGGGPSFASAWYSNGVEWLPVGQEIT